MVYFLATKLLREQGAGPTLLISPLLSLMRNQNHSKNYRHP
jgi:ATP-dependent DNA helicase RecQ